MNNIQIRTLLFATDLSESSRPAGEYALTLAELAGATVHVFHVIEHLTAKQRSLIQPETYEAFERDVEIDAFRELKSYCEKTFQGKADYTADAAIGDPFLEILRKASEVSADLIIMGTHGRSGIEHLLLGSTAERVLRKASIPVLTVRGAD